MKQLDKLAQLKPLYDEITDSLTTCNTDKYLFCVMLHYPELIVTGWLVDRSDKAHSSSFKIENDMFLVTNTCGMGLKEIQEMLFILNNWLNGETE